MPKSPTKRLSKLEIDRLFSRADQQQEAGNLRSAFRLFLACAKAGNSGAQINLGNLYSDGTGLKPNRAKALFWYRRAYRNGYSAAALNLGILFRNEGDLKQSLAWFERALKLDDLEAHMEIAKIQMKNGNREQAIHHLKLIIKAKPYLDVTQDSGEKAARILKRLKTKVSQKLP